MTASSTYRTPVSKEEARLLLCAVMRGEAVEWPPETDRIFYDTILEQCGYHGIAALICHLLKPTDAWDYFPELFKDGLNQALKIRVVIEMVRSMDLIALQDALEKAGISILVLKGGALAYTHYPIPYLRSRGDTDIFIDTGDIQKIQDLFLDLGYQINGPIYKSHQFNCYRKKTHGNVVNYDVHWRSSNLPKYARIISHEEGLEGAIPIPALNSCLSLNPEHALLQSCMHRAGNPNHDPDRLIWLYDIHLLISGMSESELLRFAERVLKEDVQAVCLEAMQKTRSCFATPVPENVLEMLSSTPMARSISRVFAESYLGLILDDLRSLPGARSRLGMIRELLMPSANDLLLKYNKQNILWVPVLFVRYLFGGLTKRVSLR